MKISVETGFFRDILKAISLNGLVETPVMTFKENYLGSANIDMANVSMAVCRFAKEAFLEYEVNGEEEKVAIDADKTMKLLRQISGDEITIEKKNNSLIFVSEHERVKVPILEKKEMKKTPLIEIDENGEISLTDTYEPQLSETIPVLHKEIEAMGEFTTTFEVKEKKLSIMQETADGYLFESVIKDDVVSEDLTAMFTTEYLKPVFGATIGNEILLKLGKDAMPMVVEDKTSNYQTVFLLVPRVEYNG